MSKITTNTKSNYLFTTLNSFDDYPPMKSARDVNNISIKDKFSVFMKRKENLNKTKKDNLDQSQNLNAYGEKRNSNLSDNSNISSDMNYDVNFGAKTGRGEDESYRKGKNKNTNLTVKPDRSKLKISLNLKGINSRGLGTNPLTISEDTGGKLNGVNTTRLNFNFKRYSNNMNKYNRKSDKSLGGNINKYFSISQMEGDYDISNNNNNNDTPFQIIPKYLNSKIYEDLISTTDEIKQISVNVKNTLQEFENNKIDYKESEVVYNQYMNELKDAKNTRNKIIAEIHQINNELEVIKVSIILGKSYLFI
jgi:hypothetical protein